MHLPTLYTVITDFERLGIGSAGDATSDRDAAIDQFADAPGPSRAFVLEFDVETNAFETAREVTADFQQVIDDRRAARGWAAE